MYEQKKYENVIVFVMGHTGSGKLAVAKELVKHDNFKLVDADTIQYPIFSLLEIDNFVPDEVWERVGPVRDAVLDTIQELSPKHFSFVFTYEMFESYEYSEYLFKRIKEVADARKALFVPVRLLCDEEELVRRIQIPERKELYKSTDPERAKKQIKEQPVFKSAELHEITINNTELSPEDVANQIIEHINKVG